MRCISAWEELGGMLVWVQQGPALHRRGGLAGAAGYVRLFGNTATLAGDDDNGVVNERGCGCTAL